MLVHPAHYVILAFTKRHLQVACCCFCSIVTVPGCLNPPPSKQDETVLGLSCSCLQAVTAITYHRVSTAATTLVPTHMLCCPAGASLADVDVDIFTAATDSWQWAEFLQPETRRLLGDEKKDGPAVSCTFFSCLSLGHVGLLHLQPSSGLERPLAV